MNTYTPVRGMTICLNDTGDYVTKADYDLLAQENAELKSFLSKEADDPNLFDTLAALRARVAELENALRNCALAASGGHGDQIAWIVEGAAIDAAKGDAK